MTYDGVHPIVFKKSLVTFAENSGSPSEDIYTETPKVTKLLRKALYIAFEPESFVFKLIHCCPDQPESLSAATKFYNPLKSKQ